MSRHTKIVATLGPGLIDAGVPQRMVQAGIDVVRMNFSHGSAEDHRARATAIRAAAAKYGRTVGILGDLQGPKIRIGKFEEGKIDLVVGASLIWMLNAPSATPSGSGSTTRNCRKTSSPKTSCSSMTAGSS